MKPKMSDGALWLSEERWITYIVAALLLWSEWWGGWGWGWRRTAPGEVNFKWQVGLQRLQRARWMEQTAATVRVAELNCAAALLLGCSFCWRWRLDGWRRRRMVEVPVRQNLFESAEAEAETVLAQWWLCSLMKLLFLLLLLLPIARWSKMKDERVQHWKLSYLTNRRVVRHSRMQQYKGVPEAKASKTRGRREKSSSAAAWLQEATITSLQKAIRNFSRFGRLMTHRV